MEIEATETHFKEAFTSESRKRREIITFNTISLEVAEYNLKGNMLDAAAFYSQQAVEKALK